MTYDCGSKFLKKKIYSFVCMQAMKVNFNNQFQLQLLRNKKFKNLTTSFINISHFCLPD